ncbi:hypothetical protein SapgrDRAFT_3264 [Saprospira grandis DSM 2844]|uniref:TIGR02646 family protein n=1 Tax=Saprospira grandis DSM 2844 TaxID=694433 RepID=J1I8W1_9BACT|nr:HNH endonuclease [Saprospira grandis]EJF54908.1 hypothetical protein SapgrDRAFT_3264 [Saprospira grandis DSM 2844]
MIFIDKGKNKPKFYASDRYKKKLFNELKVLKTILDTRKYKFVYRGYANALRKGFRSYRENDVYYSKCAYCETVMRTNDIEIEHFRPKGPLKTWDASKDRAQNKLSNTVIPDTGYYWLACDWDNLLPSCPGCNKSGTGKGSWFPLVEESTRGLRSAGQGAEVDEEPLLLNPTKNIDFGKFLSFKEDGTVKPSLGLSPEDLRKAQATIDIYGLGREGLVDARAAVILSLKLELSKDFELSEIQQTYLASSSEFSLMASQVIENLIEAM